MSPTEPSFLAENQNVTFVPKTKPEPSWLEHEEPIRKLMNLPRCLCSSRQPAGPRPAGPRPPAGQRSAERRLCQRRPGGDGEPQPTAAAAGGAGRWAAEGLRGGGALPDEDGPHEASTRGRYGRRGLLAGRLGAPCCPLPPTICQCVSIYFQNNFLILLLTSKRPERKTEILPKLNVIYFVYCEVKFFLMHWTVF